VVHESGWNPDDHDNLTPTTSNLACDPKYATWSALADAQENLPINCVNWWEAYAFCIWDGGFLPSEAELEYAAAGGRQQRVFPWGSADPGPETGYANYDDIGCHEYPVCIAPVGMSAGGAGAWGQLDLAGELWEWTMDTYGPYVSPCVDCAALTSTGSRSVHGGNFAAGAAWLVPSARLPAPPGDRNPTLGFRCARAP
jgi:formylglycine-generating enzyme required for sulfatase activity